MLGEEVRLKLLQISSKLQELADLITSALDLYESEPIIK